MPILRTFRRRSAALALGAGVLLAAACDFTVTNPGPILDEQLDSPTAVASLVNGMGGDLSNAIGNYLTRGSLAAFELAHSGNFAAERQFATGVIRAEDVNGDWARLQGARWVAEDGLRRMQRVLGTAFEANPNTPRAYLYAGYANRFLGENVCETTIDGGPRRPHTEHFVRAESLFTRALAVAGTNATLASAARAGRAQVRVNLGKWDDAVADAALVPVTFRHNAVFSINSTRENMDLAVQTINRREVTVFGTQWVASPDPRARYDTVRTTTGGFQTGQDGRTRFFRQAKYLTIGDPVPLAKGTEMLLIRAEALLRTNDVPGAMALINQGRAAASLPALTATTSAAAWPILVRERGAVLWLEGRRLYDLRRWLADGRDTSLQGRSACMPISLEELGANPNLR
jgi:hypothetical protein